MSKILDDVKIFDEILYSLKLIVLTFVLGGGGGGCCGGGCFGNGGRFDSGCVDGGIFGFLLDSEKKMTELLVSD